MKLTLQQSEYFWADLLKQVDWYERNAGVFIAERFVSAVEKTLAALSLNPSIGRRRFPSEPQFTDLRSFPVSKPFNRILIFYRCDSRVFYAERLIHGGRDLQRRLSESPYEEP